LAICGLFGQGKFRAKSANQEQKLERLFDGIILIFKSIFIFLMENLRQNKDKTNPGMKSY
jgi:hypothetical protein